MAITTGTCVCGLPMNICTAQTGCGCYPLGLLRAQYVTGYRANSEKDPSGLDAHAPGAKLDAGKQAAGVLLDFARALGLVADVGTYGVQKYSRGGWQEVQDGPTRYLDAALRHLLKHGAGEHLDPDTGLPHLSHATWNLLAVVELGARA